MISVWEKVNVIVVKDEFEKTLQKFSFSLNDNVINYLYDSYYKDPMVRLVFSKRINWFMDLMTAKEIKRLYMVKKCKA